MKETNVKILDLPMNQRYRNAMLKDVIRRRVCKMRGVYLYDGYTEGDVIGELERAFHQGAQAQSVMFGGLRRKLGFATIFISIVMLCAGVLIREAASPYFGFATYAAPMVPLPAEHQRRGVITKTFPTAIELLIVSPEEFRKLHPGANAVAHIGGGKLCRVVIPSGWEIFALPISAEAVWVSNKNGDTLAHEILHCLRGKWHP